MNTQENLINQNKVVALLLNLFYHIYLELLYSLFYIRSILPILII